MRRIKFTEDWDKKDSILLTTIRKFAYWHQGEYIKAVFPSKEFICLIQSVSIVKFGTIADNLFREDTKIGGKYLSNTEILNIFKKYLGSSSKEQTVALYFLVNVTKTLSLADN